MDINIKTSMENNISLEALFFYKEKENNTFIEDFDFKYGNIEEVRYLDNGGKRKFLVGLGEEKLLTTEKIRNIAATLTRELNKRKVETIHFTNLGELGLSKEKLEIFIEGLILGNYKFDKYKSDKKANSLKKVEIYLDIDGKELIENAKLMAECNMIARDLINEPANYMYPETLSKEVEKLGIEYGFETVVYDEKQIENLNMNAFLSVAKGSNNPPRLIVMKYMGDMESQEILGLVGKGITFDSGGYSLKSTTSMVDMRNDMGGAGAVIGAMCAIAKKKIKKNVVAVVAACENIISSKAYKPGDIITSMSGKTIEILNTDCEGRLTLIDAVHYIINNENANKVVTIATLTGAAFTVLGNVATPVVSNSENLYNDLEKSSKLCDEKVWRLPTFDEYRELIIGENADLKNTSGKHGGCITAGLFIGEFVGNTPWVHMDIAATVFSKESKGYKSKGATGEGARALYYLAKQ